MMNDFNLHFNNPDNSDKNAGWYTDSNSEQPRFVPFLYYNNFQFCKVGIYLQENSIEFGGHHSCRDTNNRILNLILYKMDRLFLSKFRKRIRVPIEAGDCVILILDYLMPLANLFYHKNRYLWKTKK
jgi:hypothetical protein